MMPRIQTKDRSLLQWRRPTDHPDDEGCSDAIWIANGFGGRYCIQSDPDHFILWLDDDRLWFKKFATIEKAKRYAECRFQHKVNKLHKRLHG